MRKTIKVIVIMAIVVLCGAAVYYFNQGNIKNVHRTIPQSEIYSQQDIAGAMDLVEKKFNHDFRGCALTDLWYDEGTSAPAAKEWAAQYHADEAIVLLSNYKADSSGGNKSLDANSTCTDWQWILVRNKTGGPWQLETSGNGSF